MTISGNQSANNPQVILDAEPKSQRINKNVPLTSNVGVINNDEMVENIPEEKNEKRDNNLNPGVSIIFYNIHLSESIIISMFPLNSKVCSLF